ncbi:nuclear lim interactor-interacting factor-related [Schistosoma mansoni]|nr:nuclear lim interactor-interacting factor-related [Schistosoma mansoni]|eukprot:XP_018649828.1 nuclear lim interactor-interacting factor-related [Schistosoma mansoni]
MYPLSILLISSRCANMVRQHGLTFIMWIRLYTDRD